MKRFLPLLLTALIFLTACAQNEQVVQSFEGFYFDTYISIRVYDPGVPLPDGLKELCEEAEKTCSATDPDSELYRFNRGQIDEEKQLFSVTIWSSACPGVAPANSGPEA